MSNTTVPAAATGLPTRRLFLASGSAGAVFGAVSAAAAITSSPAPTGLAKLVGLIEAHRKAEKLVSAALTARDETEQRFHKSVMNAEFESGLFDDWSFDHRNVDQCRRRLAGFLDHEKGLLARALYRVDASMRESFKQLWDQHVVKTLAQFDAFCAGVETLRAQSGYLDAQRSATEALQAADALLLEICGWRCGSIEELRVKGKYLLQNEEFYVNGTQEEALFRSLAEAPDVAG